MSLCGEARSPLGLTPLAISANPQSTPAAIEFDHSTFEVGTQLPVRDLPLPAGVETTLVPDETVLKVSVAEVDTETDTGDDAPVEPGDDAAAPGG